MRGVRARRTAHADGYLDLRPSTMFAEQTKYLDEALHADARHERVSPPLLGSDDPQRHAAAFLRLRPGDCVVDLGCGSGRTLVWNHATAARTRSASTSARSSPHEARRGLGSAARRSAAAAVRRRHVRQGVFAGRLRTPLAGGAARHARRRWRGCIDAWRCAVRLLARAQELAARARPAWINALARRLERIGLIDLRQERLRKSDHLNPLARHSRPRAGGARAGFRIARSATTRRSSAASSRTS